MSEDQLAEGRKVNALVVLCGIMAIAGDMIGDVSSNPKSFCGGSSFNPRQKAKRKQRMKMSNRSKKRNRR